MVEDCPDTASISRCRIALSRSDDGGRSWTPLGRQFVLERAKHRRYDDLHASLVFADHLHGWLYGAWLLRTDDGGRTWTPQHLPQDIEQMGIAGDVAWAVSGNCDGPCARTVYRADVEDGVWRPVPSQLGIEGDTHLTPMGPRSAFLLHNTGDTSVAKLDETADAGRTWSRLHLPDCASWYADLTPVNMRDLWLLCGTEGTSSYEGRQLFHTVDGARTWDLVAQTHGYPFPSHPNPPIPNIPSAGAGGLSLVDHGGLLLSEWDAGAPIFYRSADGGRSWRKVLQLQGPTQGGNQSDPLHITLISLNAPVLWRSSDGGRTWTRVPRLV
jgi:photosystem II stability/assembly factor-like uncharacterized protein